MNNKGLLVLFVLMFSGALSTYLWGQKISELSDEEKMELFTKKTEERVNDLEVAIITIADKSRDPELRQLAIENAVKYFINEQTVFEVSSKNKPDYLIQLPVRQYFSRLFTLPYDRVEIKWVESQWVTKWRETPDGKYAATVRVFQVFKGYGPEGGLKYEDITSKDIEVQLEVLTKDLGEVEKEILIVALGDVRVIETR